MADKDSVRIVVFPVGQGNCILIRFPCKGGYCHGVIDCSIGGGAPISEYLRRPWFPLDTPIEDSVLGLRFVMLTHYHMDHMGGIDALVGSDFSFSCEEVVYPLPGPYALVKRGNKGPNVHKKLNAIASLVHERQMNVAHQGVDFSWLFGSRDASGRYTCMTLAPTAQAVSLRMEELTDVDNDTGPNALSAAFHLQHGQNVVVFGGDVETAQWDEVIDHAKKTGLVDRLRADVVIVPHHGGEGNAASLWNVLSKRALDTTDTPPPNGEVETWAKTLGVISCGEMRDLPTESTLSLLSESGVNLICTAKAGVCKEKCRSLSVEDAPTYEMRTGSELPGCLMPVAGSIDGAGLPAALTVPQSYRAGSICIDLPFDGPPICYRHNGTTHERWDGALCHWN